jgi:DNA-binding XRE family transcriptional regulator
MADYLYVCQFSNGHIKVGRSIEPKSRVATHADRVSCMGIELADHFIVECVGPAAPREAALIRRCVEESETRFRSEWFAGLDFQSVCEWAGEAARLEVTDLTQDEPDTFGKRLTAAREALKLTQSALGERLKGVTKQSVSHWECDRYEPNLSQLRALCEALGVSADHLLGISQQPA